MRNLIFFAMVFLSASNVNARKWIPAPSQELNDSIMRMEMQTYPLPEKSHVSCVITDDLGFDIEFLEYDGHKYYDLAKKDKNGKVIMRNKKVVTEPTLAHCFILHGIREKGVKYKYNDSEHVTMSFILDEPTNEMVVAVWGNISPNKIGENKPDGRFTIPFYIGDTWTLGNKTKKFPKQIRAVKFNGLALRDKKTYASACNFTDVHLIIDKKAHIHRHSTSQYIVIDIPDDKYFYDRPNVKFKNKYTLNHDSLPRKNLDSFIPPRFVGGADSLERFLYKNINKNSYPPYNNIYQKFDISLTVTPSGEVRDVQTIGTIEPPLADAIRKTLVTSRWKPGGIKLSFSQENLEWPILIKDVQIFVNCEEDFIAKLSSKPKLKPAGLYAIKMPTPLFTEPSIDSNTIRIQDGKGGESRIRTR